MTQWLYSQHPWGLTTICNSSFRRSDTLPTSTGTVNAHSTHKNNFIHTQLLKLRLTSLNPSFEMNMPWPSKCLYALSYKSNLQTTIPKHWRNVRDPTVHMTQMTREVTIVTEQNQNYPLLCPLLPLRLDGGSSWHSSLSIQGRTIIWWDRLLLKIFLFCLFVVSVVNYERPKT